MTGVTQARDDGGLDWSNNGKGGEKQPYLESTCAGVSYRIAVETSLRWSAMERSRGMGQ